MDSSLWKQKKIFVTGSAGFIGQYVVNILRSYGAEVQENKLNLLQENLVSRDYGFQDYIFHLAAQSPAATDTVDTAQIIRDNVAMTMNVLEFARTAGAKVVAASSSHVYPPVTGTNAHSLDELEMVPGKTLSALGSSKQETERVCREFAEKYGVSIVITRMSNVYGPGDRFNRFIPTFVRKCLRRQLPLEVLGSGETIRDFIYIDDAVEGLLSVALTQEPLTIFNVGGAAASIAEVAEAIKQAAGLGAETIRYLNPEKSFISYNVLNWNKAKKKSGYQPKVSLAEGIQKTVSWWRKQEKNQVS